MRSSLFSPNIIQLCMDTPSTPKLRVTAYTSAQKGASRSVILPRCTSVHSSSAFFQFFLRFQLKEDKLEQPCALQDSSCAQSFRATDQAPGSCNSICPLQKNCQLSWWTLANLFTCFQLFLSLFTFDSKFFPNPRRFFFFLMGGS